jgi:hypothetical protein
MTGGHDKALHVLVEDSVASSVLAEIIRRSDAMFLKTIAIHPSGDTKTIHSIMIALKETGLPVAAVRDAGIVREDGTVDYHARTGKLEHSSFDVRITLPRLGTHIGAAYRSLAAPTTSSA